MVNSRRGRTVELKIRRKGGRTIGSYTKIFYGLQGRVLFTAGEIIFVEVDVAKGRVALERVDAYVRKRWGKKSPEWRAEWEKQVARWQKALA